MQIQRHEHARLNCDSTYPVLQCPYSRCTLLHFICCCPITGDSRLRPVVKLLWTHHAWLRRCDMFDILPEFLEGDLSEGIVIMSEGHLTVGLGAGEVSVCGDQKWQIAQKRLPVRIENRKPSKIPLIYSFYSTRR